MREAKDSGDVVEARLRAVLDGGARVPAVPGDGPLDWADIVPAWSSEEDDVSPLGTDSPGGVAGPPGGGSGGSPGEPFGVIPVAGPAYPWDSSGFLRQPTAPSLSVPSVAVPSVPSAAVLSGPVSTVVVPSGPTASGDSMPFEAPAAQVSSPPAARGAAPGRPSEGGLGGEGAFEGGPGQWLHAFDPGRPGVRALGAVAVVVVLVAGFLAWQSRPRLDPVVPSEPAPSSSPATSGSGGGDLVVAVGGKVRKPGLVRLSPGARVADALSAAGGAEPGVDVAALNLARKVTDGELIMVGVTPAPGVVTGPVPTAGGAAPGGLVNLNTATLAELDSLPGVGPVLAQRILDARQAQGGFRAVTDLRKVDGIGETRYEQLKDLVTV